MKVVFELWVGAKFEVCDPHLFFFFYYLCSNEKGLNGIQTHCISTWMKMIFFLKGQNPSIQWKALWAEYRTNKIQDICSLHAWQKFKIELQWVIDVNNFYILLQVREGKRVALPIFSPSVSLMVKSEKPRDHRRKSKHLPHSKLNPFVLLIYPLRQPCAPMTLIGMICQQQKLINRKKCPSIHCEWQLLFYSFNSK